MLWAKFDWNWSCGYGEGENVKSLRMNEQTVRRRTKSDHKSLVELIGMIINIHCLSAFEQQLLGAH